MSSLKQMELYRENYLKFIKYTKLSIYMVTTFKFKDQYVLNQQTKNFV